MSVSQQFVAFRNSHIRSIHSNYNAIHSCHSPATEPSRISEPGEFRGLARTFMPRPIILLLLTGFLLGLSFIHTTLASASKGTLKWQFDQIGDFWYSSPAIGSEGTVYVTSCNCYLYAIDSNGSLKWNYNIGYRQPIASSPAIGSDETVYVGSDDGYLYAINPNGSLKWKYGTGSSSYSSPAIGSDGTVYFGSKSDTYLYVLYAVHANGSLKWQFETGLYVCSTPPPPAIGSDGTVYFANETGNLYAVNSNGSLKWKYNTGSPTSASPAIGSDGTVYVGSDLIGNFYAVNANGSLKWKFETGSTTGSPAIGSDGTVYVGSDDGYLYAINPNGSLKWRFETGGKGNCLVPGSPAIGSDGIMYFGSCDGNLYAIDSNGSLEWKYTLAYVTAWSPAVGSDGTVYVGSDVYLHAITCSSKGLANSPWPMFQHDAQLTGRVKQGPPTSPKAPTEVMATAGNAHATVTFTPPASDGGSPIISYKVIASPGGKTAKGIASPITVKGLTNGTAYTFKARATNAIGTGPASSASNTVTPVGPPKAPTEVTATAGNAKATVTFTPPASDGGSPIISFKVTSSPGGKTAKGMASPITVKGLMNGTAYTFKVRAINAIGTGPVSGASNSVTPGN